MQLRIRTIKPQMFKHETLFDLEKETGLPIRFAWSGLFAIADREGRFNWRPRTIKAEILPYDDVDFGKVLEALEGKGMIVKYSEGAESYGWIPTFLKHQVVNTREAKSSLPAPPAHILAMHVHAPACAGNAHAEGKGREGKGREGEERVEDAPPPAQESSTTEEEIGPVGGLQGNSLLDQVLPDVAKSIRASWLEIYDHAWLKVCLVRAIEHHMDKNKALSPRDIEGWQKKFTAWLKTERSPKFKPKAPPAKVHIPKSPWPTGAKERALGNVRAIDAMAAAKMGAS